METNTTPSPPKFSAAPGPAEKDRLGLQAKLGLLLIALLGIAATVFAAQTFARQTDDQRTEALQDAYELISVEASERLANAFNAGQRTSLVPVAMWPTPDQFTQSINELSPALPEQSSAIVILQVPEERLSSFVASEQSINADFEIVGQSAAPPASGHLIVMRTVGSELPIGTDLTSSARLGEELRSLPLSGVHTLHGTTFSGTLSGNMQIIVHSRSQGPDLERYESFSIVSIDLAVLLEDVHQAAGPGFGASVASAEVAELALGPERTLESQLFSGSILAGPDEFELEVWSDGSGSDTSTSAVVLIVGLLATAALTLLSYLFIALARNRRRSRLDSLEARSDHLTGVPNRRWLAEYLTGFEGQDVAVLFCDLDRFKVVNDSAGHGAGDQILLDVVSRLRAVLPEDCALARFGGDEFVIVVCCDADVLGRAQMVAGEVNRVMADPFKIGGSEFSTTMSIGIASSTQTTPVSGEELIRAADVALGRGKQQGRNCIVVYDDSLREAELDRLELERELRAALDDGDLIMFYQPIVDSERRIVSYEALVRWERQGGLVPPFRFLPVVDEIGRMVDLGHIVLRKSIAEFVAGIDPTSSTTLHVNVDAQLLASASFPTFVSDLLAEFELDPGRLILELTEGEWVDSIDGIEPSLEALGQLGIGFAIDDFGAGYSNIGRALSVQGLKEIKLDRSLVRKVYDNRNAAFLAGFSETMLSLGVVLIAEGIETEQDYLATCNVDIQGFQGYLFARPAPASEVDFAATHIEVEATDQRPTRSATTDTTQKHRSST